MQFKEFFLFINNELKKGYRLAYIKYMILYAIYIQLVIPILRITIPLYPQNKIGIYLEHS